MKRFLLFLLFSLFISNSGFAQNTGITYQAVIYNPDGEELPGVDNPYAPLINQSICIQFSIVDADGNTEYQEQAQATTDAFGMVNLLIGTNTQTEGYAVDFANVEWSEATKFLVVELDVKGNCMSFLEISNQPLTYVPFAHYAENSSADEVLDALIVVVDQNELDSETADAELQQDIDQNEANGIATDLELQDAIAALQADVDQNESDADTADATLQSNIDTAVANATEAITNNAIANATTQVDVDQNESDADAAIAALQADVDQNESDADTADATLQSNIDTAVANATAAITNNAVAIATTQADVAANTAKVGYTEAAVSANTDVAANTAKVGYTEAAVSANTDVAANTAKVGYTEAAVSANTDVAANTAKVGYTEAAVSANTDVAANTAKYSKNEVDALIANLQSQINNLPPADVGDFYGGGVVFYIFESGDTGYVEGETHGLIAAVQDQSSGIRWYNGYYVATGATGFAIGTGSANTDAIISSQGGGGASAGVAWAYTGGGFTDWFLPSKDELNQMYTNKATINTTASANGGSNFSTNHYWCSTEINYGVAWAQSFNNGNQSAFYKTVTFPCVRAVRAF